MLAIRDPLGRLAALLLIVTTTVLVATPPWSIAYTGLAAPALALLFGCAVARLAAVHPRLRPLAALVVVAGLLGYAAATLPGLTFGSPFPGRTLGRVFASTPGCVTTDDPIALIETGALRRNLDLRCPLVLDPGGYSYDLQPGAGRQHGRAGNRAVAAVRPGPPGRGHHFGRGPVPVRPRAESRDEGPDRDLAAGRRRRRLPGPPPASSDRRPGPLRRNSAIRGLSVASLGKRMADIPARFLSRIQRALRGRR